MARAAANCVLEQIHKLGTEEEQRILAERIYARIKAMLEWYQSITVRRS
jgi:hypothetical protein